MGLSCKWGFLVPPSEGALMGQVFFGGLGEGRAREMLGLLKLDCAAAMGPLKGNE